MNETTKILIAGANGFLGKLLSEHFLNNGHQVIQLVRKRDHYLKGVKQLIWDGEQLDQWRYIMNEVDIVINLAGKSVDCRYNEENKKAIFDSRLKSTSVIGEAIKQAKHKPVLWINASSATIYQHTFIKDMDEYKGIVGDDFSEEVCKQWEQVAIDHQVEGCRQVLLRTSMVLGAKGGVFPVLKKLVKWGLGGKQGHGSQFMSFIHAQDFIRVVEWIIDKKELEGAINCTAPYPTPNLIFMRLMRQAIAIPFGLAAKKWMLEIGAFFIRTETELVLKSRRVIPTKLMKSGFRFLYPQADIAIQQLVQRKK